MNDNVTTVRPRDSWITRTPGVCGGRACIRDTRVPVWSIVKLRLGGLNIEEIMYNFPGLTVDDFWESVVYYGNNIDEIELDIKQQE